LIQVNARKNSFQRDSISRPQEDLMQINKPRSTGKLTTLSEYDELLDCRMAMLGLHLDATESGNSDTFNEIMRRCTSCGYREACAADLKRDPNDPVWETYCPNLGALIALAEARWLPQ
jgi:hypothetical protein